MSVQPSNCRFFHLYKKRTFLQSQKYNDYTEMSKNRTRSFPFFGQMTSRIHKQFLNRGLISCITHKPETRPDHKAITAPTFQPHAPHPVRIHQLLEQPRANLESQTRHAWNPEDRSLNIFIKDDNIFSIHRHPVAQSTDGIRSKIGFSTGVHLWEITWPNRQRGTHAVVGIATKEAPLHCPGYKPLIGNNSDSWGWDIGANKLIHQGLDVTSKTHALPPVDANQNFAIPDTFGLVLDMQQGSLGFVINGRYLGVAFDGLKGKTVFPAVSAVWGHCEVSMHYVCSLPSQPLSLLELSKREIERKVRGGTYEEILQLPLPNLLKLLVVENAPEPHKPHIHALLNHKQPSLPQPQSPPQKKTQQPHRLQPKQQQRSNTDHHLYISKVPQQQNMQQLQQAQQQHIQQHIQRVRQSKYYHHYSIKADDR